MEKGFVTLEILLAMALMVMAICTLLPLVAGGQSASVGSATSQEALYKARDLLEQAYIDAKTDFNSVNPIVPIQEDIYQKSLTVTTSEDYLEKTVTSSVSWQGVHGQNLRVDLTSLVVDVESLQSGNICNSVVADPESWKTPHSHVWDMGDLGVNGGDGFGFVISDVKNYQGKLYATMSATPAGNKDTFFVFDVSDDVSQAPAYQLSFDNAPTVSGNLAGVVVSGNHAYLLNSYGANFSTCSAAANCAQLQVVDLTTFLIIKNVKMPVSGNSGRGAGNSIFYHDGYVYVGLSKTAGGPEFNILDVGGGSGSPANPVWKGGYSFGTAVNSIVVKHDYAYIATPNAENMTVLDISNPENPVRVGGYTPSVGSNNGESLYVVGKTAYLGRAFGSNELYALDVSTPSSISVKGVKDVGTGNQTSIRGLVVKNTLAFDMTKSQFQVWDISDMANIKPWSSDGSANSFLSFSSLGGTGNSLSCSGDYFYASVASAEGDKIAIIAP